MKSMITEKGLVKIADALTRAYKAGKITLSAVRKAAKSQKGHRPRTLKTLGFGQEGVAQLRTHGEHGVAVAKIYDKKGARYSADILKDKVRLHLELNRVAPKHSSTFYGVDAKHKNVHYSQYVDKRVKWRGHLPSKQEKSLIDLGIGDVTPNNKIQGRIVDFYPTKGKAVEKITNRLEKNRHLAFRRSSPQETILNTYKLK